MGPDETLVAQAQPWLQWYGGLIEARQTMTPEELAAQPWLTYDHTKQDDVIITKPWDLWMESATTNQIIACNSGGGATC